jgi:hypothetical protein
MSWQPNPRLRDPSSLDKPIGFVEPIPISDGSTNAPLRESITTPAAPHDMWAFLKGFIK